jgi:hypothetical protein
MSISRRGIILTQKANGVEVKFPSGEKRFCINCKLTGEVADQDRIIFEAGKPKDYFKQEVGNADKTRD